MGGRLPSDFGSLYVLVSVYNDRYRWPCEVLIRIADAYFEPFSWWPSLLMRGLKFQSDSVRNWTQADEIGRLRGRRVDPRPANVLEFTDTYL